MFRKEIKDTKGTGIAYFIFHLNNDNYKHIINILFVKEKQFNVPILMVLFNRIDTLQVLFNQVRQQKPRYLYLYADGPRLNVSGEKEKCEQARSIINQIDWDCEIITNFQKDNSGSAAISVSHAISWFFQHVDYGIIFEHDTIPHSDYFAFCEELLEKYKDDERISMINGVNFQYGITRGDGSYYFSGMLTSTWGFATWRRFWKHYDLFLENYPYDLLQSRSFSSHWRPSQVVVPSLPLRAMFLWKPENPTYQSGFTSYKLHGLAIIPNVNMIKNIGGGPEATNYKDVNNFRLNRETYPILPIKHPSKVERNIDAENYQFKKVELRPTMFLPKINKSIRLNLNSSVIFLLWSLWRWTRRNFIKKKIPNLSVVK